MAIVNPLNYGKRLIPHILDDLVLSEPDRVVYSLASFPDQKAHLQTITAGAFARAVDKTAWFLREQLAKRIESQVDGNGKKAILPIGYIGPRKSGEHSAFILFLIHDIDDLRHILLIYGSIKANCGVCCTSFQC